MVAYCYIDSNVVSGIAAQRFPDFIGFIKSIGMGCIVSDIVLKEVSSGSPIGEIELLKKHGVVFFEAREPHFRGQGVLVREVCQYQHDSSPSCLEDFLLRMRISLAGNPTADISFAALRETVHEFLGQSLAEIGAEPRLEAALLSAIDGQLEAVSHITPPTINKDDLKKHGLARGFFTHIKPPQVIQQIIDRVTRISVAEPNLLEMCGLSPISDDEDFRSRIYGAGACLTAWGFCRDPDVGKPNPTKSLGGARAQDRDLWHIAASANMRAFVSADKDCAKLA